MIRLIHTADWHLGNTMHDTDRSGEQNAFLQWLKRIVFENSIDALVVSGDVFDVSNPSNEAKKMYYSFLASLLQTDCRNVIVVGGNHDSGDMLDATKDVFDALNIHVIGKIGERSIPDLVFELLGKDGECVALCAAIPYLRESELRKYYEASYERAGMEVPSGIVWDTDEAKFNDRAYGELYQQLLQEIEARKAGRDIPVIVTGHLYAAGLEGRYGDIEKAVGAADQDREIVTDDGVLQLDVRGKLGKVHSNIFPKEFSYVALGHIHYQTRVGGEERIRYSGSPFVMGFEDANIPRCVLQVDLSGSEAEGFAPVVKLLEVPKTNLYRRITGSKEEILRKIEDLAGKARSEESAYAGIFLEIEYETADRASLEAAIEEMKLPEKLQIMHWKRKREDADRYGVFREYSMTQMKELSVEEVAESLIRSRLSIDPDRSEEEAARFRELVETFLPYFRRAEARVKVAAGNSDDTEEDGDPTL